MTFAPSPMQQAILDWIKTGKGSAIIDAKAGAGKTATIELALPVIPETATVTLISFGKIIARELESRINNLRDTTGRKFANVRASTFHSLGFGALRYRLKNAKVNTNKLRDVLAANLGQDQIALYGDYARQLVGYARGEGIGAITPDTEETWWNLANHHCMFLDSEDADETKAIEIARKLLKWSNDYSQKTGIIDFDDQLYLPLLWKLRFFQVDYVFVDEAQDTSPVRRAILRLITKPGTGRLIAVGDPNQAIFGFTGASNDSLGLIAKDFNTQTFPLSVCYRCSTAVVNHAAEMVPAITVAPNAVAGSVADLAPVDMLTTLTSADAILCRNTAPLVKMAYSIIARGKGCKILGREIGSGLVKLVQSQKAKDLVSLDQKLQAYQEREIAKHTASGNETKSAAVSDRVECIRAIVAQLPGNAGISALISKIESMFCDDDDSRPLLTLATIHKAKGKEYPQVAILRRDLMPSKFARQAWQMEQEGNIEYVARTRAQVNLFYLSGELAE